MCLGVVILHGVPRVMLGDTGTEDDEEQEGSTGSYSYAGR